MPDYTEEQLSDRMNSIRNYYEFAVGSKYLRDTLCPALLDKAQSLPIKEKIASFANIVRKYSIGTNDKNASSAIEKITKAKYTLLNFDTLIDLQKVYFPLKNQVEQKSSTFQNISEAFSEYSNQIVLPTGHSSEDIKRMRIINFDMQNISHNIDTLVDLQKSYFSLKKQIEESSADYKNISATFVEYVNQNALPNGFSSNDINTMRTKNSNMQNILQTLKKNDLKALEKEIKGLKKDTDAKIKKLIGI